MFQFFLRKKNWPIIFLICSISAFAEVTKVCSNESATEKDGIYSFSPFQTKCLQKENCWIQFQAPEDSYRIDVNGKTFIDLTDPSSYYSNEFFMLPFNIQNINEMVVYAKDTNQDRRFLNQLCMQIGSYQELRWSNSWHWFLRTGVNLFSAYFLILISIFLGLSFWMQRSAIGFSLFIYSIISTVYLFSFSEYPRSMIDPVLASGGLHFPLRLLQDLCLIYVFYNFYRHTDKHDVIKKISLVYGGVISIYLVMLLVGIQQYVFFARLIIIMAPLVAAPMAIGTWFSFKLKDPIERKVLIPISILLFMFQFNDLLVFWKLVDGYFTVRFYIPFIVGMCLFMYFRRIHEKEAALNVLSERQRILKEFLHDVKSPLAVLRIFFTSINFKDDHHNVVGSALDRIENMVHQIDRPNKNEIDEKFRVISTLVEVLEQKKIELPQLKINFSFDGDAYTWGSRAKIQRVFSNIINNSFESYSQDQNKTLDIKVVFGADDIHIFFSDKGRGIPKKILNKLFKEEITDKTGGRGVGLFSSYRHIDELGGDLKVVSKENFGTTIEIKLPTSTGDVELSEIEENEAGKRESPDLILIDDDRYIRLSWKLHAQNSGKTIKTFDSLDNFFSEASIFDKKVPIYLDINLGGTKSLEHLYKFQEMGFENITLATGEYIPLDQLPAGVRGLAGKLPPLN